MEFLQSLITAITTGLTALVSPMVVALQDGFNAFLYGETAGTESQVVTDIAIFMFALLGMSIGVGLVWLAISIFRGRSRARV